MLTPLERARSRGKATLRSRGAGTRSVAGNTALAAGVLPAPVAGTDVELEGYRLVVGSSPAMREAVRLARTVAPSEATVPLLGESGTGKEVMARAIHRWSRWAAGPFVAIDCTTLTLELLASELFGREIRRTWPAAGSPHWCPPAPAARAGGRARSWQA